MSKKIIVLIALFLYLLFHAFVVEPNSLEVTKYELKNSTLKGVRIVFMSDLMLKRRDYKRLDKIIKLTEKQEPSIVLIGGNFARGKNYKNSMDVELIAQKFKSLGVSVFAVLGDYDWWSDGKTIIDKLTKDGITVLENSNKRIILNGSYVDIIGVADLRTRQSDIQKAMSRTRNPRILITHNPDIYYDVIDEVSVILAGGTLGGQVILPFSSPMFVNSKYGVGFASGLISKTNNKMIISKGVGTAPIPIRFGCKPEIVVADFVD